MKRFQSSDKVEQMIRQKKSPLTTRRKFGSEWHELSYLCKKVHYWLYTHNKKANAKRYADRLDRALKALPRNNVAIIRQEGMALLCELTGRIKDAIKYRTREIALIERLHREAASHGASTRAYMLQGREASDLQERHSILEALLIENTVRAHSAIRRSG
jgi:hypothetical protein